MILPFNFIMMKRCSGGAMETRKDLRLIFRCTAVACIIASINMSCTSPPPSELPDETITETFQLKYSFSPTEVTNLSIIEKKVLGDTATVRVRCEFMPDSRLAENLGESVVVNMSFKKYYTGWQLETADDFSNL
jgi:hypothetical protein